MSKSPTGLLAFLLLAPLAPAQQRHCVFDAPLVVADANSRMNRVGDLDGDGDEDAIGFWNYEWGSGGIRGRVRGFLNDGLGKMTQAWSLDYQMPYTTTIDREEDAIGDLNGDGLDDYVFKTRTLTWLLMSNGAAAPTVFDLSTTAPRHFCIADFTGDGVDDLGGYVNSGFNVVIQSWDSATNAFVTVASVACGCAGEFLMPVECNGDGELDLMFASPGFIRFFPFVGGQLQGPIFLSTQISADMFAPGDVDGDGDMDITVFAMTNYRLLRRTGPSTFTLEPIVDGGPATDLVDVDGDGDLDGVCCGGTRGQSTDSNLGLSIFRVSHNDGTGVFAPAIEIPGLGSLHIAGVVDLEDDGDMDLVAGRAIYYPRGPITAPVMTPIGARQNERNCYDFDRDGDPDFSCGAGLYLRNYGDGAPQLTMPLIEPAPAPAGDQGPGFPGDYDGDGDLDVIVRRSDGSPVRMMALLVNDGTGALFDGGVVGPPGVDFFTVLQPSDSLAEDVDGDGDVDLITKNSTQGIPGCKLWINQLPSGFALGPVLDVVPLHVGDLTGDGLPDLVTAGSIGVMELRRGLGNAAFAAPVNIGGALYLHQDQIAVTDIDHDGDDDLLAIGIGPTSPALGEAAFFLNDGAGNFTQTLFGARFGHTPDVPGMVRVFDATCDGLDDLVFGSPAGAMNGVAVYPRKSDDSGWDDPVVQCCFWWNVQYGDLWSAPVVRDADGDGDLDLVTNYVIENRRYVRPTAGERHQFGDPDAGSGGVEPVLGATGPFRSGETVTMRLTGARASARGRLELLDVTDWTPFPSTGLHPGQPHGGPIAIVPFVTSIGDGLPGSGEWTSSFPIDASLAYRTLRLSAVIRDPAGPLGIVRTNAVDLTFGP